MNKLVLLLLAALCACAKTESDSILTRGMHASFEARANDGTTTVSATLFQGEPIQLIFIELTGDDQLIAWHGNDDKVMNEVELLNVVSHHATFPNDEEGDVFEIELRRTVDGGAPMSTTTLPAKFELDPVPASASRAANLQLTWAPAGSSDRMAWKLEGDCIELASGSINGDPGSVTIAANTIRKRMPQEGTTIPDSCNARLEVTRTRAGDVDPAFGRGGSFDGVQVRTATFTTAP